jgi:hypothetical protein
MAEEHEEDEEDTEVNRRRSMNAMGFFPMDLIQLPCHQTGWLIDQLFSLVSCFVFPSGNKI